MTVGVIMPMIALSEVGRDKVAARRTCLNAGRQKVNRPNVAREHLNLSYKPANLLVGS